jgi:Inner membrane component of T3SS, cytoplasmic domain/Domain of unknown function (DUF1707)
MAGSAADTPTTPEFIRVSDTDRDRAVDELRKEFVDGRLSHETFVLRMQAALDARNHGQLSGLFSDLPPRVSWVSRARQAVRQWGHDAREAVADSLPRRREDVYYEEAPPPPRLPPLAALPEPDRVPKPLMFPPGPDTAFTIGRDQRCDLYIADMTVSRLHARLSRGHEGWLLSDLGSSNGTRVNGWRLRAAVPVQPGDTITFGSAVFVLQPEAPQPEVPPPAAPPPEAPRVEALPPAAPPAEASSPEP